MLIFHVSSSSVLGCPERLGRKVSLYNSPHQFKTNAQMIPKVEIVQHVNDVVRSIGIFFTKFIENANLDERLMMKTLFVANDFDCNILIDFMVQCANHLPETAFANHFQYFIAIANVVMNHLWIKIIKINDVDVTEE